MQVRQAEVAHIEHHDALDLMEPLVLEQDGEIGARLDPLDHVRDVRVACLVLAEGMSPRVAEGVHRHVARREDADHAVNLFRLPVGKGFGHFLDEDGREKDVSLFGAGDKDDGLGKHVFRRGEGEMATGVGDRELRQFLEGGADMVHLLGRELGDGVPLVAAVVLPRHVEGRHHDERDLPDVRLDAARLGALEHCVELAGAALEEDTAQVAVFIDLYLIVAPRHNRRLGRPAQPAQADENQARDPLNAPLTHVVLYFLLGAAAERR